VRIYVTSHFRIIAAGPAIAASWSDHGAAAVKRTAVSARQAPLSPFAALHAISGFHCGRGELIAQAEKPIYGYLAPENEGKPMPNRILAALLPAALAAAALGQSAPQRPAITGISHLAVYASDAAAAEHYFTAVVGAVKLPDPENPQGVRYALSATQFIEVLPLPAGAGINRLDHSAWNTVSAEGMRKYLAAKGWTTPAHVTRGADGSRWFEVLDPEGNKVQFVQPPKTPKPVDAPNALGHHIIHIGFLVHDRAAEDKFYRDLLGFRPYWWGGMQEGKIDWVSQQVPDGHDWLEYMLSAGPGTGIPPTMSQNTLGVLDHFSIGEVSVPDTYKMLVSSGRLEGRHDQGPKIGKDGKYQFNMYTPDGTRLEMMNFHATEKPCCSPFTADDPAN
jgi:catechol 2,3-dioxygenase-like lactoylglutathione lyase family enzyme